MPSIRPVTFNEIARKYHSSVYYFFCNRGFTREDCADLTQETFFRVYRGIEGFRGEASPKTWVLRIATNVYNNELRFRRTKKREHTAVSLDEPIGEEGATHVDRLAEAATPANDPSERLLSEEQRAQLHRAIESLPPKQQQCMLLRIGQDLSYQEIADVLHIQIGTVKSHLNMAKNRLRGLLRDDFDGLDEID